MVDSTDVGDETYFCHINKQLNDNKSEFVRKLKQ